MKRLSPTGRARRTATSASRAARLTTLVVEDRSTRMSGAAAKSLEGKQAAAHDLIAPVYAWFTEGFDTRDLIDAKALLDELR